MLLRTGVAACESFGMCTHSSWNSTVLNSSHVCIVTCTDIWRSCLVMDPGIHSNMCENLALVAWVNVFPVPSGWQRLWCFQNYNADGLCPRQAALQRQYFHCTYFAQCELYKVDITVWSKGIGTCRCM